ncbi:MAG: dTMP kinase [Clostridiales bacterium]|nr:dTMP kinase [Clostridiales bacterium]
MRGKFITFEGCEGVGKSRQIKMLEEYLAVNNKQYYLTREPGGTPVSEQIRGVILDGKNTTMTDECEALLYAAARVQLLKENVKPRLDRGELVLCDRYIDSSLAYQGYARGLGVDFVEKINDYAIRNFMPDYTVFLKLPPEIAFKRKGGVDKNDRLELSGMEFHNKVYEGYLDLAKRYPERFIVIDASGEREETHKKIINALKEKGVI